MRGVGWRHGVGWGASHPHVTRVQSAGRAVSEWHRPSPGGPAGSSLPPAGRATPIDLHMSLLPSLSRSDRESLRRSRSPEGLGPLHQGTEAQHWDVEEAGRGTAPLQHRPPTGYRHPAPCTPICTRHPGEGLGRDWLISKIFDSFLGAFSRLVSYISALF